MTGRTYPPVRSVTRYFSEEAKEWLNSHTVERDGWEAIERRKDFIEGLLTGMGVSPESAVVDFHKMTVTVTLK